MSTHAPFLGTFDCDPVGEWEREDLDEPAFARRTRRLPLLSGTEEEAESALIAVHYAPRRPRWTEDAPTQPGFYFVRRTDTPVGTVVMVERDASGGLVFGWTGTQWLSVRTPGLLWSNRPIQEPE